MNSTGNKLKVNAASEGKLNSHEQRESGSGINKMKTEVEFWLISRIMPHGKLTSETNLN